MIPALFLHFTGHLDAGGGGVQACTREYFTTLRAAGFDLTAVTIPYDRGLPAKIRRRFWPDPYSSWFSTDDAVRVVMSSITSTPQYVFINQHALGSIVPALRQKLPSTTRYVVLSHGLESTDFLHEMRDIGGPPRKLATPRRTFMLGWRLVQEARQLRELDHVFCLSSFEREIEHWLGARNVTMVPRVIVPEPLDWKPAGNRLGFVGTIDHRPNEEGLILFLDALERSGAAAEVRVAGGPRWAGEKLARRYSAVRYLGPLGDEPLRAEAATWSCFLHPVFCYARGASTKLATALSWELPIATTTTGARGYVWKNGSLAIAEDPEPFAQLALSLLDMETASRAREEARRAAHSSPTVEEIAALMRNALGIV